MLNVRRIKVYFVGSFSLKYMYNLHEVIFWSSQVTKLSPKIWFVSYGRLLHQVAETTVVAPTRHQSFDVPTEALNIVHLKQFGSHKSTILFSEVFDVDMPYRIIGRKN